MSDNFKGIYYSVTGKRSKPAVMFLHGFMGDSRDWSEVIDRLKEDAFCITIDLPGHGRSNNPDSIRNLRDVEAFISIINDILRQLHIKKIDLVGYSLGGRIAQHFALKYPLAVNKLILESSSFGIEDEKERKIRLASDKKLSSRLQTEDFEIFLDEWYSQAIFSGLKDHPGYQQMFKRRLLNNPMLLSRALQAFSVGRQSFLQEKISDLKLKILYICGDKDTKYYEIMTKAAQMNPGNKCIVMDACGHNTHFEKPNLFAEHLREFLSL